jgi:Plant mobile domain
MDKSLITTLVERWKSESSILHLSIGEMVVTLEDVCALWGFTIHDILLFFIF